MSRRGPDGAEPGSGPNWHTPDVANPGTPLVPLGLVRDPPTSRRGSPPRYAIEARSVRLARDHDLDLGHRTVRAVRPKRAHLGRRSVAVPPIREVPRDSRAQRQRWLARLAGLLIGGSALYLIAQTRPQAQPIPPPAPVELSAPVQTVVEPPPRLTAEATDGAGRPTRIVGGDPAAVLEAYCRAGGTDDTWVPLGVRDDPAGKRGVRLGVLQRSSDRLRDYALWIRFDPRTSLWFVGDDHHPVEAYPLDR